MEEHGVAHRQTSDPGRISTGGPRTKEKKREREEKDRMRKEHSEGLQSRKRLQSFFFFFFTRQRGSGGGRRAGRAGRAGTASSLNGGSQLPVEIGEGGQVGIRRRIN